MNSDQTKYRIDVAGEVRLLPVIEVSVGVRIPFLNILGDTKLIQAAARALKEQLTDTPVQVIVVPAVKSILLGYALSVEMNVPFVVLTKTRKPYMGNYFTEEVRSITTEQKQHLYLSEQDAAILAGKQVVLLDDVISSGATVRAMEQLAKRSGAIISGRACIFTEGDRERWLDVISLGHLPVL